MRNEFEDTFEQGRQAAFDGRVLQENPFYKEGPDRCYERWNDGWKQATAEMAKEMQRSIKFARQLEFQDLLMKITVWVILLTLIGGPCYIAYRFIVKYW
jgi:ribosome modulation factor